MADYDIFREQLAIKHPSYGHALWGPSPRNPDRPVQVGDVGFIRRGNFHRLFNTLLPADDPSHELGLPEYYEPLIPKLSDHLHTMSLNRNNYCSAGVIVESDPGYHAGPDDFPQVSFHCKYRRTRGAAALSLPVAARREDTLAQGDFGRWIVKHIGSWFAFARGLGLGIEDMEEIILVTGCDRTRSWINISFLENEADAQVSFGVRVEVEGPDTSINFQFSPENARGAVLLHGPEGTNLPENQCVFIRGFRASRSFWKLSTRIRAAAGPSSDPGGYDRDPDVELISIPAVSKHCDPLHLLLDYVAEQASDCDMVVAHDNDLVKIDGIGHGTLLETVEPNVMMDILRRSNIEIHKALCDLSPTNTLRGSNTDTANVKVAMLSMTFENWNTAFPSHWSPLVAQNIDFGHISDSRGTRPPAVLGNLPVPTIRGDTYDSKISIPPNAGTAIATRLLNAMRKQLPVSREKRGHDKLDQAREMMKEFESVIAEDDRRVIEDRIACAREMKVGLGAKSGISKLLHAREYRRASRDAYRYAKHALDRGRDVAQFQLQSGTSSGPEDINNRVTRTAQSLYRCFLSCRDAFPSPDRKEELAKAVWDEACAREGAHPDLLRQDEEFVYSSMGFITDIKVKVEHIVESVYELQTSQAPNSISRNARCAQALLTNMTFVYGELNFGGRPNHPYRHPIIQKVINITWFQNRDDDGIAFQEFFAPIPVEVIALALTVIECCIGEWFDGTWKDSNWNEERYKAVYRLHQNSLYDLRNPGHHKQGEDVLVKIQHDLLKGARSHAGASPDPITGSGRLLIESLDAALRDDLPEYNQIPEIRASYEHELDFTRGLEDIESRVIRTAQSLYRCFLSCRDAFPSPDRKEELATAVWDEACAREGAHPDLLRQDEEFVYSSMRLLTDVKMKIDHAVEYSYEFNTSRDPDSISHNARCAQALLTNMTFVYGELNFGGRPNHPYRHPIIQKVIDITWFQNMDDDGIVFYEYFTPIPIEVIALALTIECCIDEWSDGTWKESNWGEERHKAIYYSHLNSLGDLGHHQGVDLAQMQYDLLKSARIHAGAPPDYIMGSGRPPWKP